MRRRFACELLADDRRHLGTILDLSGHGLFVQTRLRPASRRRVPLAVRLRLPPQKSELVLATELVRYFRVPAAMMAAVGGGVGLRIQSAPEAWREFVRNLSPGALCAGGDAATEPRPATRRPS